MHPGPHLEDVGLRRLRAEHRVEGEHAVPVRELHAEAVLGDHRHGLGRERSE